MRNLFSSDNLFNKSLTKVFDLCWLNILVFISCIPVITAGAAFTAMYSVMLAMTEDKEDAITKMYVREFKASLKGSIGVWVIILLGVLILLFDIFMWSKANHQYRSLFYAFTVAILLMICAWSDWYFAIRAKFEDTAKTAMKNAAKFTLICFPMSIAMGAGTILVMVLLVNYPMCLVLLPIFGFVLFAYPKSHYIRRKFDAYIESRDEQ